jgi:hypothetical protein
MDTGFPAVEIADHRYLSGIRCPDGEMGPGGSILFHWVRPNFS